tara:strand:+ start:1231 stop:2037 length:807 start_codon:yes stop_codon:yes gene_type:complete
MSPGRVLHSKNFPLSGQRFLVTRKDTPESSLSLLLQSKGAAVVVFAMTKIIPPESWQSFDETVKSSLKIDWVVFTSSNGVSFCVSRLKYLQIEPQLFFSKFKIACVGKSTASTLSRHGIKVELIPDHFQSEGLIDSFSQYDLGNKQCWLIQAESPRKTLCIALKKKGAKIISTPVYRTAPSAKNASLMLEELDQANLDWVIFASPSAVQNFHHFLPDRFWEDLAEKPKIACIGETTEFSVKSLGWCVELRPAIQDFEHLVKALCEQQQ